MILSRGTRVTLRNGKKAVLSRDTKVARVEGPITTIPAEVFYELVQHMEGKEFLHFCETNTSFYALCSDDVIWKRRIQKEYGIDLLPEEYKTWRNFYMALTVPRKIRIELYKPFSINIHYRTNIMWLRSKVINHARMSKYSIVNIIAVARKYPYKLVEQKDWERAYIEGIIDIRVYINITMEGFFILTYGKGRIVKPYMGGGSISLLFSDEPAESETEFYREIIVIIPTLHVRIIYTLQSEEEDPDEPYRIEFDFTSPVTYNEHTPMRNILSTLGYKKNDQEYYPNIHGTVEFRK